MKASYTVEIRNRADKNPASTGYRFRFKSLVTAANTPLYDLHTIKYTYDALSRVVGANYYPGQNTIATPSRTYSFTYDLAGNRTQANNNGSIVNYTYNALNQVTSGGVSYDASGRMISDGTSAYTWDRANRLLTVGGMAFTYAYNGVGQRIQQSVGVTVTQYLLDTQPGLFQTLTETTGVNVTRYVQGPTGLQQIQQPGGNWQQAIPDALGSVRAVVDANNALLDTRLYAPYGEVFGPTGTSQTGYGFTGEPTDGNGLVYLRARYYSPGLGVFTRLDPFEGQMEKAGSLNRYAWVNGNVANRVDPSGMINEKPERWARCIPNPPNNYDIGSCNSLPFQQCLECCGNPPPPSCVSDCFKSSSSNSDGRCAILEYQVSNIVQSKKYNGEQTLSELIKYAQSQFKYNDAASLVDDISCAITGARGTTTLQSARFAKPLPLGYGGWHKDYDDGTNNQAYHFWAYVNSAAQGSGGSFLGFVGDYYHECWDPTDPQGKSLSDSRLAFVGNFFSSTIQKKGFRPIQIASWVDEWVGNKSFNEFLDTYRLKWLWIFMDSRICPYIDRNR